MKRRPVIGVIGSSQAEERVLKLAEQVGQELALAHCHLLCGGRGGVMEAACRGHQRGREGDPSDLKTLGLLPGYALEEANDFVDIVLPTGLGLARNTVVASASQGLIALSGGAGTLSEVAFAWQLGRPLVAVSGSGGWAGELAGAALDEKQKRKIARAETPKEAVRCILEMLSLIK